MDARSLALAPFTAIANAYRGAKNAVQGAFQTGLTPKDQALGRFLAGAPSVSGKIVTPETAMTLSAAWSCMRIIAEAVGTIPWQMYKRDKTGGTQRAPEYDLASILEGSPNVDMTPVELREAVTLNLTQVGNSYSKIERLAGRVTSLYPISSTNVQPKRKSGNNTKLNIPEGGIFYSILDRGMWVDFPREEIWHVKGFGSDGFMGLSPIGMAREAIGFGLATDEFGNRFFSQGGKPSGVITVPGWLQEDQRKIARENLTQLLGGLANAHKFALMEGGMKPEPWGDMSLQDMAFVQVRGMTVQDMCRIFRIPPHMVADVQKGASFASIEQMSSEFVMFTLLPYFTRLEASVTKWLIPAADRGTYFLKFNYEALLRADSTARAAFYTSGLQNGWLSRNEVRAKENMNRVDGLDDYTAQVNLAPVDMLGELAMNATQKPAVDPAPAPGKSGDTNVTANVALPAAMKHEIEHSTPALTELVTGVKQVIELSSQGNRDIAALIKSGNAAIVETMVDGQAVLARRMIDGQTELASELGAGVAQIAESVKMAAQASRRLVLNKAGDPVGTELAVDGDLRPRTIN